MVVSVSMNSIASPGRRVGPGEGETARETNPKAAVRSMDLAWRASERTGGVLGVLWRVPLAWRSSTTSPPIHGVSWP